MRSTHKVLLCIQKYDSVLQEKHWDDCIAAQTSSFYHGMSIVFERATDKLWLFIHW